MAELKYKRTRISGIIGRFFQPNRKKNIRHMKYDQYVTLMNYNRYFTAFVVFTLSSILKDFVKNVICAF